MRLGPQKFTIITLCIISYSCNRSLQRKSVNPDKLTPVVPVETPADTNLPPVIQNPEETIPGSMDPVVETPAPPAFFVPDPDASSSLFQWVGILGNGQSLSVGADSGPVITTGPSYNNLKLADSSGNFNSHGPHLSVVPLTEPFRPTSVTNVYPANIFGETFHGLMASTITELSRTIANRDIITAHSVTGVAGSAMDGIKKNGTTTAYAAGLFEAYTYKNIATSAGKTFGYGAVVLTHGESDWATSGYARMMFDMYIDYNIDLKTITGQTKDIPLFISQQHSFPSGQIPSPAAASTQQQWLSSLDYPGKVILVGPKYQYSYADGVHLTAAGYEDFGKKIGEVYYRVLEKKENWKPLSPLSLVAVDASTIRVTFHVPNPPLVFNNALTPPHQTTFPQWANGKGFEVKNLDGSAAIINSVTINGNAVDISIANSTNLVRTVGYAITKDDISTFTSGTIGGRYGLLMDSDTMVNQPNYAIAFETPVQFNDPSVTQIPGRVRDISTNGVTLYAVGDVWTDGHGENMMSRTSDTGAWMPFVATGKRVDTDSGTVWTTSEGTGVIHATSGPTPFAIALPGGLPAVDIGIGGTGGAYTAFIVNTSGAIHRLNGGSWSPVAGSVKDLDVDSNGKLWGFDVNDRLYYHDGTNWNDLGVDGLSISVNGIDTVYIVKKSDRNVYHKLAGSMTWVQDTTSGGFDKVAATDSGKIYMISGERLFVK